uniref:hypothetical protein n=1 Tax=Aggregatilinea sp. TaxID=2806333 RepID=UPI002C2D5A76
MSEHGNNDLPTSWTPLSSISAAELIRITRALTRRITNQDRQRLARDLRESGHTRSLLTDAPIDLQQFFAGEIDLDDDLSERYVNATLLSHSRLNKLPGDPPRRRATLILSSQDDSVSMAVDSYQNAEKVVFIDFTFTLLSTLSQKFPLNGVQPVDAKLWLALMRRDSGITFLWTRARWDKPYFIFVVREHFARFYAFSPQGYEASVRLTPDMVNQLCAWLNAVWLTPAEDPEPEAPEQKPQVSACPSRPGTPTVPPASAPPSANGGSQPAPAA